MTEQQTPDREKKIAEIRVKVEFLDGCESKVEIDSSAIAQDYKFLLSELDRIEREYAEERVAHNAHVTELCELEEENRRMREELDKLIEGLKFYANEDNWRSTRFVVGRAEADSGQTAQAILDEIGVTAE